MSPEIREVTDPGALEALRPEWAALWGRCPAATPFQSPEWLIPWWRHIGEGDLWTLALRSPEDGRLVGLVPLYIYTQPRDGERAVFPLGIATTDYLDALFEPGWEPCGMAAVFAHLQAHRGRWDACEWPQLRPGSPLLASDAPEPWAEEVAQGEPCPVLPLPATVAGLAEALPSLPRRKLRYYWRRAERLGQMRVERAADAADAADTLGAHYDALLRLHGVRWGERGESGVLADPGVQRMHREALPGLLANGMLRLYALRLDEKTVGVVYALADPPGRPGGRLYFYIGGFDPDYAEIAPGSVLIGHAIEEAVRDGLTAADFLRGREPYKYVWGARDTPTYCRRLRRAPAPLPPLPRAGEGG